jgi:hypothetical protein
MTPDDVVPGSPKTPLEWWTMIRAKGLSAALRALSVGQIYAIITTAIALGAGVFAFITAHRAQPDDLVLCAHANGYPVGAWLSTGRVTEYDKDAYKEGPPAVADLIIFDTPLAGHIRTDEIGSKGATFTVSQALRPGTTIHIVAVDKNSKDRVPYQSEADLVVSRDGCMMTTELWWDNYDQVYPGHPRQSGTARYFWIARDAYWVKRDAIPEETVAYRKAER